jgi:hypothetical protein
VLAGAAGGAGAANEVRLTAVSGEASTSSGALDAHADLADGQKIETADGSGCSALVDQNAVVELCDETRVSFSTDPKRGNRIVNVEAGTLRMFVEKREPGERIEIHTPAAIATILGTILYVTVDPATGEETFTSSDSDVNVRSREAGECTPSGLPAEPGVPACAKGTTIGGLEQLRIAPGATQFETASVSEQELARLGGCLIDFHELAARIDRATQESRAIDRAIAVDVAAADLPPVSVEDGPAIDDGDSGGDLDAELEPFDDQSQEELIRESLTPDDSSGCGAIPGEHC